MFYMRMPLYVLLLITFFASPSWAQEEEPFLPVVTAAGKQADENNDGKLSVSELSAMEADALAREVSKGIRDGDANPNTSASATLQLEDSKVVIVMAQVRLDEMVYGANTEAGFSQIIIARLTKTDHERAAQILVGELQVAQRYQRKGILASYFEASSIPIATHAKMLVAARRVTRSEEEGQQKDFFADILSLFTDEQLIAFFSPLRTEDAATATRVLTELLDSSIATEENLPALTSNQEDRAFVLGAVPELLRDKPWNASRFFDSERQFFSSDEAITALLSCDDETLAMIVGSKVDNVLTDVVVNLLQRLYNQDRDRVLRLATSDASTKYPIVRGRLFAHFLNVDPTNPFRTRLLIENNPSILRIIAPDYQGVLPGEDLYNAIQRMIPGYTEAAQLLRVQAVNVLFRAGKITDEVREQFNAASATDLEATRRQEEEAAASIVRASRTREIRSRRFYAINDTRTDTSITSMAKWFRNKLDQTVTVAIGPLHFSSSIQAISRKIKAKLALALMPELYQGIQQTLKKQQERLRALEEMPASRQQDRLKTAMEKNLKVLELIEAIFVVGSEGDPIAAWSKPVGSAIEQQPRIEEHRREVKGLVETSGVLEWKEFANIGSIEGDLAPASYGAEDWRLALLWPVMKLLGNYNFAAENPQSFDTGVEFMLAAAGAGAIDALQSATEFNGLAGEAQFLSPGKIVAELANFDITHESAFPAYLDTLDQNRASIVTAVSKNPVVAKSEDVVEVTVAGVAIKTIGLSRGFAVIPQAEDFLSRAIQLRLDAYASPDLRAHFEIIDEIDFDDPGTASADFGLRVAINYLDESERYRDRYGKTYEGLRFAESTAIALASLEESEMSRVEPRSTRAGEETWQALIEQVPGTWDLLAAYASHIYSVAVSLPEEHQLDRASHEQLRTLADLATRFAGLTQDGVRIEENVPFVKLIDEDKVLSLRELIRSDEGLADRKPVITRLHADRLTRMRTYGATGCVKELYLVLGSDSLGEPKLAIFPALQILEIVDSADSTRTSLSHASDLASGEVSGVQRVFPTPEGSTYLDDIWPRQ